MEVTCPALLFRLARISSSSRSKPRSFLARSGSALRRLSLSSRGHHPKPELEGGRFALHDAQLVLARQYGFATWARLKDEVERLASDFSQRTTRFVRDAVEGDSFRARRALALEPDLARADQWAALAAGEIALIEKEIRIDASWVNRQGGPKGDWTPLLYISFSCFLYAALAGESEEAKLSGG